MTKRPEVPTLYRTTPSMFGPCLVQTMFNDYNRATLPSLWQIQTLFSTDSPKIIYSVQGRGAKKRTLSGGRSPCRSHKGVPPGGDVNTESDYHKRVQATLNRSFHTG